MPFVRRLSIALLALACLPGCQVFEKIPSPAALLHELKPHRLARWNRGKAPPVDDAYFSVPDPLPAGRDGGKGELTEELMLPPAKR